MQKDKYRTEIGRRIAEAREAKGMTLAQLKSATSLGTTTLSNYEQGTRMPGPFEVSLIAKATGTRAAYLMCLEDDKRVQAQSDKSPTWIDARAEDLPEVFKEALRLKVQRYIEIVSKLPVAVVTMFKPPTSTNYWQWESDVEASYRSLVEGRSENFHGLPEAQQIIDFDLGDLDIGIAKEIFYLLKDSSVEGRETVLRAARNAAKFGAQYPRIRTRN